jgi:hypothetical protein
MILSKRCRTFLVDWTIIVATSTPIVFMFYYFKSQPEEPVKFLSARLERDVIKGGEPIVVVALAVRTKSCPALINDFIVRVDDKEDNAAPNPKSVEAVWRQSEIAGGYTLADGKAKHVRFEIQPNVYQAGTYEFRSIRADLCDDGVTAPKFPSLRFTVEE